MKSRHNKRTTAGKGMFFLTIVFFIASNSLILMGQREGYITFHTDFSEGSPQEAQVDIYKIIDGKEIFEASTYSALASKYAIKENLTLTRNPGIYDFIIKTYSPKHNLQVYYATIKGLIVKENSITYVGLNPICSGTLITVMASVGSIPLPVVPKTEADIITVKNALYDSDWATRKFAINMFSNSIQVVDEEVIEDIGTMATDDRYLAVRKEAINFLESRNLPVPYEPPYLYLTTFTNIDQWRWYHEDTDPKYSLNSAGYNIVTTNTAISAAWMKDLFAGNGFFGNDPKKLINYDIELDCIWNSGMDNGAFGLFLGNGGNYWVSGTHNPSPNIYNFYAFCISKNGSAIIFHFEDNQLKSTIANWTQVASSSITSHNTNRLKVEVRENQLTFFVNNILIGSFHADETYLSQCIGMVILHSMDVCFTRLAIIKKE